MKSEHKKFILDHIDKQPIQKIAQTLDIKERKIKAFLEKEKKKKQALLPPHPSPPVNKKTALSLFFIALLGFSIYANSLGNQFLWDDYQLVVKNNYIKGWSRVGDVFTKNVSLNPGEKFNFYRPLQMLTYMFDYAFWKLNVKAYHLTNICLHVLVALVFFGMVKLIFGEWLLALFASLLFMAHPIHTEAVTYISGRADPLAAVFILAGFIFYIKYLQTNRLSHYLAVLLSYVAALLSRENSLIFPACLLFYHYVFRKKIKLPGFLPILIITGGYIFLRLTFLKALLPQAAVHPTALFQRLPGFFAACAGYLRLLALPLNLHMEYGNVLYQFVHAPVLFGLAAVSMLWVYAFKKKRDDHLALFAIGWFFIMLLPVSNLYPLDASMAEHWLYLPSMGYFLVLAGLLRRFYQIKNMKFFALASFALLLAFYSYLTIRQNTYWKEPVSFYERTLRYGEPTPRLLNNLGNAYMAEGRKEEAKLAYGKSIALDAGYVNAYVNLAALYDGQRESKEAMDLYEKALELDPQNAQISNNLGMAYLHLGQREKAISLFKKIIETTPDYVEAYSNLAYANEGLGNTQEAVAFYKKAIELNPFYAKAYNNLGHLYYTLGQIEQAIASYQKAIGVNPNYALAHHNLAVAYFYNKQYPLAIQNCDEARALGLTNEAFLKVLEPYRK